jgi:hypothetical protein
MPLWFEEFGEGGGGWETVGTAVEWGGEDLEGGEVCCCDGACVCDGGGRTGLEEGLERVRAFHASETNSNFRLGGVGQQKAEPPVCMEEAKRLGVSGSTRTLP